MMRPVRFWMTRTKSEASVRLSIVPVSSQASPLSKVWTCSLPRRRYSALMEVISSSPRAEGWTFLAISITSLS